MTYAVSKSQLEAYRSNRQSNDINWDEYFRTHGTRVDGAVTNPAPGTGYTASRPLEKSRPAGSGYNHPRSNSWLTGIMDGGNDSNAHTQEYRPGRDNIGDPVHRGPFTGAADARTTWQLMGDKKPTDKRVHGDASSADREVRGMLYRGHHEDRTLGFCYSLYDDNGELVGVYSAKKGVVWMASYTQSTLTGYSAIGITKPRPQNGTEWDTYFTRNGTIVAPSDAISAYADSWTQRNVSADQATLTRSQFFTGGNTYFNYGDGTPARLDSRRQSLRDAISNQIGVVQMQPTGPLRADRGITHAGVLMDSLPDQSDMIWVADKDGEVATRDSYTASLGSVQAEMAAANHDAPGWDAWFATQTPPVTGPGSNGSNGGSNGGSNTPGSPWSTGRYEPGKHDQGGFQTLPHNPGDRGNQVLLVLVEDQIPRMIPGDWAGFDSEYGRFKKDLKRRETPRSNMKYSDLGLLLWKAGPADLKKDLQKKYGLPHVKIIKGALDDKRTTYVPPGGGGRFEYIPDDHLVGSSGAQPCIIVIVTSPPDNAGHVTAWVYHCEAGDDPISTLALYGPFPPGSHVAIAGGDNNDPGSMQTLEDVRYYFEEGEGKGVAIDGIYNSPGLWVDNKGKYYVFSPEDRLRTNDGTLPPPAPHP